MHRRYTLSFPAPSLLSVYNLGQVDFDTFSKAGIWEFYIFVFIYNLYININNSHIPALEKAQTYVSMYLSV